MRHNHYYPFGLKHSNYNTDVARYKTDQSGNHIVIAPTERSDYQYKYNGKEYQDELGLNFYDYGARNYDPAIGRWMNLDALAENYTNMSLYAYVANNPLIYIDPDGMLAEDMVTGIIKIETDFAKPPVGFIPENGATHTDKDGTWIYNSEANTWIGQNGVANVDNSLPLEEVVIQTNIKEADSYDKNTEFASLVVIPIVISQVDSPVPGPADLIAALVFVAIYEYCYGPSATTIGRYDSMSQRGDNNCKLQDDELERILARKSAGTASSSDLQKLKKHEKNTNQRSSRKSKDRK